MKERTVIIQPMTIDEVDEAIRSSYPAVIYDGNWIPPKVKFLTDPTHPQKILAIWHPKKPLTYDQKNACLIVTIGNTEDSQGERIITQGTHGKGFHNIYMTINISQKANIRIGYYFYNYSSKNYSRPGKGVLENVTDRVK